jgi:hypothetical protein
MKQLPFQSDLRDCASGEPRPEPVELRVQNVQKITEKTETFFLKIESQGFRK